MSIGEACAACLSAVTECLTHFGITVEKRLYAFD